MCASIVSRLCECWAPALRPAPVWVRKTIGHWSAPEVMYGSFAAWLRIGSRQTPMKSMNMISTIGRRPVMAAPTAAPT